MRQWSLSTYSELGLRGWKKDKSCPEGVYKTHTLKEQCIGGAIQGCKRQNSQPRASGIWRSTHPVPQVWIHELGASYSAFFGGRRIGSQRDQGWIPGLLFLTTVTLWETEYNPCLPVTVRRTLDEIVHIKDPTWFLAPSAPSKFGGSSPRGPLRLLPGPGARD